MSKEEHPSDSFFAIIKRYSNRIGAIHRTAPLLMAVTAEILDSAKSNIVAIIANHGTDIEWEDLAGDDGTGSDEATESDRDEDHDGTSSSGNPVREKPVRRMPKSFTIHSDYLAAYSHESRQIADTTLMIYLLPRALIVTLISDFDAYLGNLIRQMLQIKPELLKNSGRTWTYAEIQAFPDLSEFKRHAEDQLIESVLRKSHVEQFDWLEDKLKMPLRKKLECWPRFVEATERRNLYVHNDGVVTRHYLEQCRRHGADTPPVAAVGSRLTVDPEYYRSVHAIFLEIGIKLGQVIWRKLTEEEDEADSAMIGITYSLICDGEYLLAAELIRFIVEEIPRKSTDTEDYAIHLINLAQCYKWLGDKEKAEETIASLDPRRVNDKLALAVYVIRAEYDQAAEIMRRIGAKGAIDASDYRDWPLFSEFRKSDVFLRAFADTFGEEFDEYRTRVKPKLADRLTTEPQDDSFADEPRAE